MRRSEKIVGTVVGMCVLILAALFICVLPAITATKGGPGPQRVVIVDQGREVVMEAEQVRRHTRMVELVNVTRDGKSYARVLVLSGRVYHGPVDR